MSAYLDGELAAAQRARLERHSEECRQSRGLLRDLRRMLDRLHGLSPGGARAVPDIAASVRARLRESPRR